MVDLVAEVQDMVLLQEVQEHQDKVMAVAMGNQLVADMEVVEVGPVQLVLTESAAEPVVLAYLLQYLV
jgi:hypothetical protein